MSIPGRIIQTSKTRELQPLAKAAATNLKLLHPDWEYLFFTDADIKHFIDDEFSQYRATFDAFTEPIQRVDFFRYLAVFRLGGFYFDLDVLLSRPLTDLLEYDCVFPFEELTLNRFLRRRYNMDWEVGNFAFGAAPGNAFLGAVIQNCIRAQTDHEWLDPMMRGVHSLLRTDYHVFNTTGPGLVSRTFAEQTTLATNVNVLFPNNVCDRSNWHQFGDYGIHMMDGSWHTGGNSLWRRVARKIDAFSRARLLSESRRLGPVRDKLVACSDAEDKALAPSR
ncbi:MAG TPA: glycosyltransferase [Candidatus Udaeobacter sp.]|jgi:mannosyltransferase OCH1-like enzyme|nr:glycosyltransferase [Candidatus Udaeobacter sp.]